MGASVVGFIVGAILALIFYVVATAIVVFNHSDLVFGLVALLIWGFFTFAWGGTFGARRVR